MTEFRSIVAETGEASGQPIDTHGPADVAAACAVADAAFDIYRATGREERAAFLERIADEIMAIGDSLIDAAMAESGLPRARLEGPLAPQPPASAARATTGAPTPRASTPGRVGKRWADTRVRFDGGDASC